MNKLTCILWMILYSGISVFAAQDEWQNPYVNEINRAQMHTSYFAWSSHEEAEAGITVKSYGPHKG